MFTTIAKFCPFGARAFCPASFLFPLIPSINHRFKTNSPFSACFQVPPPSPTMGPPPFLSRHFLSEQAACLSLIPFAPGAPDQQSGTTATHNLLALGTWSEEAQEHHLAIVDLLVAHSGDAVCAQPSLQRLAAFQHHSRITAMQACSLGGGDVLLVAAGSDGGLSRLRMQVPLSPGSQPEAIQLHEEDMDGAAVQPWLDLHPGPTTALDLHADLRQAVSTSRRGTIAVSPLMDDGGAGAGALFYDSAGALELTCARWTTPSAFITGCTQGLLQVWDRRTPGQPAQQGTAAGHAMSCAAAHPAQAHTVATGSEGGALALWDLRQGAKPLWEAPAGAAPAATAKGRCGGVVRDLHFDSGSDALQLVFCTSEGAVGTVREGAGADAPAKLRTLYREATAGVEGLCLGSAGPLRQLFAVTDQEALLFMANVL